MPASETTRLASWASRLPAGAHLRLAPTQDPRSGALEALAAALGAALPGLVVQRLSGAETLWPWLEAGATGVRFSARPEGPKLDLLLGLLAGDYAATPLSAGREARLAAVRAPATLTLFVAPGCPHCPRALETWVTLAARCPPLGLTVVDAALFPEAAREAGVAAVPTLVLDAAWRWTGAIPTDDVLGLLATRDPARLGAAALEGMIKDGRAAAVARLMADQGSIFPAFVDLLAHAQWPVRLGAMVAVEELQVLDAALAASLAPALCGRFQGLAAAIQGDLLYIIGEVGGPDQADFVTAVAAAPGSGELGEAAREAAARLKSRHGSPQADA
jgi:glutaredoxin